VKRVFAGVIGHYDDDISGFEAGIRMREDGIALAYNGHDQGISREMSFAQQFPDNGRGGLKLHLENGGIAGELRSPADAPLQSMPVGGYGVLNRQFSQQWKSQFFNKFGHWWTLDEIMDAVDVDCE